jgi:hypothetical protein
VRAKLSHAVVALVAGLLIEGCAPYSLDHFKQIKAHTLRSNVKEWRMKGKPADFGYTNSTEKCWLVNTNIASPAVGGASIVVVMALESSVFQERGRLYAAENGAVLWIEGSNVELIKASK